MTSRLLTALPVLAPATPPTPSHAVGRAIVPAGPEATDLRGESMQMRWWRSRSRWGRPVPAALAIICLCISLATSSSASTVSTTFGRGSWPTYHGNVARTGYTNDTSIHAAERVPAPGEWDVSGTAPISAQPIVDDGVVYWGDWNGLHARRRPSRGRPCGPSPLAPRPDHQVVPSPSPPRAS